MADVVYGSRFLGFPRRVLFFWHTVGNNFLTLVSNIFTNLNLTDMETGYKVFRTEVLRSISLRSHRFDFEPEVTARIARRGLRIYEVPISYAGRTYAEGKKIKWKDGLAALWAIVRYTLTDDGPAGEKTLRRVSRLSRYNSWLWEQVAPFTGQRILEVGAGIGTMTRYLLHRELVVATDIAPSYLERLRETFNGRPNVMVRPLDLNAPLPKELQTFHLDTILCLNVLEHIKEDEAALGHFSALLSPGARVVLILPALQRLYGEIDKAIDHYRRYEKTEIEEKLRRASFQVEETRFFNTPGILGWYVNSCLLKRKAVPSLQARLNDWLVPLLRLEKHFTLPWGMSLLVVGRKA
jgi:SAM-dependent methyltransferase